MPLDEAAADTLPPWLRTFAETTSVRDLAETPISWLLLAAADVYKVKKPVLRPTLDYSTPERRRFCCDEELRLNRRFAPELYLDVVPVPGTAEAAVHMRRFEEAERLDHLCGRGALTAERVAELAQVVIDIHAGAAVAGPDTQYAEPARILEDDLGVLAECRALLTDDHGLELVAALHAWTQVAHARLAGVFAARKAAGFVREGHGDLHLANLAIYQDRVTAFDCVEFNPEFRWIDIASELAFPYVDLLDHGCPELAATLVDEWLTRSGDVTALRVLRYYAVHLAVVRAMVAAADSDSEVAVGYLELADRLSSPLAPTLLITHGPSASGKSTAAAAVVHADPLAATVRLRSDVERKRIFGLAPLASSGSSPAGGIYTPEADARTYAELAGRAGELLDAGWSVVVDATFLSRRHRDLLRRVAETRGVDFGILECSAPATELRRRLLARHGDASEATQAVLATQLAEFEPLAPDELALVRPAGVVVPVADGLDP